MDHCDACAFVYDEFPVADTATALDGYSARYEYHLTTEPATRLRRRPAAEVWSPLEYACHVRDVLTVQRERVGQTLREHTPTYVPMGRDDRVVTLRYNEQDPVSVAADLGDAARAFGAATDALAPADWVRTGIYNYPSPTERDLVWLTRHTVHEVRHHLGDLDAGLR